MRAVHLVVGACLALVATGCTDHTDPTIVAGPSLAVTGALASSTIEILPALDTISMGTSRTLQARIANSSAGVLTCCMAWASSNSAVLKVNASGVITPVAPGSATISATYKGSFRGAHEIRVLPSQAKSGTTALDITNVTVASGKKYAVVAAGVKNGAVQYIDRSFTLNSVPSVIDGATLVRTANDDKSASVGSKTFLSFDVNQDVVVYVALDPKLTRPSWMATGWTATGVTLGSTDGNKKFAVHHRSFPKGRVVLGSNVDRTTYYGMYSVAVKGTGTVAPPADTKPPTVSFAEPVAGATVSGTVAISANATDDVKVVGVRFELNGSPLGGEIVAAPYTTSWNATGAIPGSHTIKAIARDAAGNVGTATVSVTIKAPPVEPVGRYVSPTGRSTGAGTSDSPWDLATALRQPAGVVAGDTIWMRGGTYKGCYTSELRGTSAKPIVVRQYPGERAIIDNASCNNAALTANGAYTYFWGFEVMNSAPRKGGPIGINAFGDYLKFINLVVHDASDSGIGFWAPADGGEIYGTILYNNGRDFNLDHGIYTQNAVGTKRIADNIVFNSWAFGLHVYGSDNAQLKGYTIEGNALFTNGSIGENGVAPNVLVGGGTPAERIVIRDNYLYSNVAKSGNMWLGYEVTNKDLTLKDNYIAGGGAALRLWRWTTASISGNTIFGSTEIANIQGSANGFAFANNSYYRDASAKSWVLGSQYLPFTNWKTVVGAGSSDRVVATHPTGTRVFVRANEYEAGRGHVVIYNWDKTGTVSANVSSILKAGDRYEVRNVQNLFADPVLSGTYTGGSLSLPMSGNGTAAPIGGSARAPQSTGPEFQVFLIVRK